MMLNIVRIVVVAANNQVINYPSNQLSINNQ